MTNNDTITKEKLQQYEQVLELETWEEVRVKVDIDILGEMDWYLIDGLMDDYLLVTQVKESKSQAGDVKQLLLQCCDNESTLQYFKKIASQLTLEQ